MAVPLYTASPINGNASNSAFPASPSTFAMRYTPASALEEQLAANPSTPALTPGTSTSTTPSPASITAAQQSNVTAHTSNDIPLSSSSTPAIPPPTPQPTLTKLSIPTTPPTNHAQPAILSPYAPSPLSNPSYTHSRHASTISTLSTYSYTPSHHHHHNHHTQPAIHSAASSTIGSHPSSSPFLHGPDLSHPPGYIQNTRASFEDRIISTDAEEQSFLVSPVSLRRGHRHKNRASFGGGLLDGNYDYRDPVSAVEGKGTTLGDGELGRLWETAGEWLQIAAKKLGEGEKQVVRALAGDR